MDQRQLDLAIRHHRARRWEQAEAIYRRALAERPDIPEILYNLGTALKGQHKYDQAIAAFGRALELRPTFPQCLNNLANALRESHQPESAINVYLRAISQQPDFGDAWNNLGLAYKAVGLLDDALHAFGRAIEIQPNHPAAYSNRIGTMHFHSAYDAEAIGTAARQWANRFAPASANSFVGDIDRDPHRRLRIGYVSPYFRRHCQTLFTTSLFSKHDRQAFEIFCYSDVAIPDNVTDRLKAFADHWHDAAGFSDDQLIVQIRHDKIDILVDLTLHMAGHRLTAFAQKPAPIQVTWLGYPGTTGLSAIDYRLTDARLDPSPADDRVYAERSIRLPDTFWCYDPFGMDPDMQNNPPAPSVLPALSNGHITFGCLNNFCKVTDATLALWAQVFETIPNSYLILSASPGRCRQRVIENLHVSEERITFADFQPRRQYLEQFHAIDLCLDTIPYNGHTTSLDSLWMGVPVLNRIGPTVVGRAGLSQLHHLGLSELAAESDEQFVQTAVGWTSNLDRLSELRQNLRTRMERSPLMDAPRFARNIESAYRQMWQAFTPPSAWDGDELAPTTIL